MAIIWMLLERDQYAQKWYDDWFAYTKWITIQKTPLGKLVIDGKIAEGKFENQEIFEKLIAGNEVCYAKIAIFDCEEDKVKFILRS